MSRDGSGPRAPDAVADQVAMPRGGSWGSVWHAAVGGDVQAIGEVREASGGRGRMNSPKVCCITGFEVASY